MHAEWNQKDIIRVCVTGLILCRVCTGRFAARISSGKGIPTLRHILWLARLSSWRPFTEEGIHGWKTDAKRRSWARFANRGIWINKSTGRFWMYIHVLLVICREFSSRNTGELHQHGRRAFLLRWDSNWRYTVLLLEISNNWAHQEKHKQFGLSIFLHRSFYRLWQQCNISESRSKDVSPGHILLCLLVCNDWGRFTPKSCRVLSPSAATAVSNLHKTFFSHFSIPLDREDESEDESNIEMMRPIADALYQHGTGVYYNEPDFYLEDWRLQFWGSLETYMVSLTMWTNKIWLNLAKPLPQCWTQQTAGSMRSGAAYILGGCGIQMGPALSEYG